MNPKLIRYILINAFFLSCIYFGFYKGIDGAKTMAQIIAWFFIVMSGIIMLAANEKMINELAKEPSFMNRNLDLALDMFIVAAFAYFNSWVLAGFYFAHMLIMMGVRDKIDKVRREKEKEKTLQEQQKIKEQNMNFFQP